MALLVTGNFYTVTFLVTTDAAWAALAPTMPEGINGELAEAIYKAAPTPIDIYVTDAGTGTFAYPGGTAYNFDDTLLDGAAAAGTTFTLDAEDSSSTVWAVNAGGGLFYYDAAAGLLRSYATLEATAFKTFLP